MCSGTHQCQMYPVYIHHSPRKVYVGVSGQESVHCCFSVFNPYYESNSAQAPKLHKVSLWQCGELRMTAKLWISLSDQAVIWR